MPFGRAEPWRRNLYVLVLAQALTSVSFSIAFPFLPLYIGELGVSDPGRAAFWAGMANVGFNVSMFLTGPLWGAFADRYGRKINIFRALMGSAALTIVMAFSANVFQLVAFRTATGITGGIFAGTMALAAAQAPQGKAAYSIGMVQMAGFVGNIAGPMLGGVLAQQSATRQRSLPQASSSCWMGW
jgi:DHA1 family multidrug resistance protein-like MFS transporter